MTSETIDVDLGARSYQIHVGEGLLENAGAMIAPLLARPWTMIVTDANVDAAQGARLAAGLAGAGIEHDKIVLPPGEATKSFARLEHLLSDLLSRGVERSDVVIAFGGGVIGDITGFATAVLRRGCRFVQIPTSLLAQVDSSVGGKTAVNSQQGKNLIGAFHQPALVLSDLDALASLPDRERRAGYAEIVKYGALGDAEFFNWLEANSASVLKGDAAALQHAVARSCRAKAAIVADDERETGARALLNLGHTFGHALEAAFGYSERLLHGEAVAAGMGLAFDLSASLKLAPTQDAERLKRHLRGAGLPAGLSDITRLANMKGADAFSAESLLAHMYQDKKVEHGALTFILARRIGEAFIEKAVDPSVILKFLRDSGAR
ncbi:MAG: 3-dehydroquinate synthase [Parvularculaceae bacterium]